MSENDERRLAILAEMHRRAASAERKWIEHLEPIMAAIMVEVGEDAILRLGLVRAMLNMSAGITIASAGSDYDCQLRLADEFGIMAASAWDEAARELERALSTLEATGGAGNLPDEVYEQIKRASHLVPSDPSRRPDLPTKNPVSTNDRPVSLQEALSMINSAGSMSSDNSN